MLKEQYISPEIDVIIFEMKTAIMDMSNEELEWDDEVMDL